MVAIYISVVVASIIAIAWTSGIDKMHEEHPDYKGEDFLDWDDNKSHTEGKL